MIQTNQILNNTYRIEERLGAGGGGFLVFYARPEDHKKIISEFKNLLRIPFSFEDGGTRIIYYLSESYDRESAQEN